MNIKEIIKSNPLVNYLHLEYWRHRGQRELKKFNDYDFICWMYKKKCGRALDLSDPKRYTEKLQWLKLFYRNDLMPIASDKYEVREYLKSLGYDGLLNELIGVYNSVDEIDFSKLPERFVVKASHGSHWNLIVKDKTKNKSLEKEYIASKELDDRIEGLITIDKKDVFKKNGIEVKEPDLEEIMVYLERSKNNESFAL